MDLERNLEDWIEKDPSLLQEGLTIVGRQMQVEGGPMDLLAPLDAQGTWVVIELKRGDLYREAVAQALDYASSIANMAYQDLSVKVNSYLASQRLRPPVTLEALLEQAGGGQSQDSQREVRTVVVGTGLATGLERLVSYLSTRCVVPITVVAFGVFRDASGHRILVRELPLPEPMTTPQPTDGWTIESFCAKADAAGVGAGFRAILKAAQQLPVYPRPWKGAIMYAPPGNHSRCLFTTWVPWAARQANTVPLWVQADAFQQFFSVTEDTVKGILGETGWHYLGAFEVPGFVEKLKKLFDLIANPEQPEQAQVEAEEAASPLIVGMPTISNEVG